MFSLFISLRTSLKTAFVKELLFFKNKYKRGVRLQRQLITRGPRFHAAGDLGARCCCVFFARLSLKGEIASERTQAFTLFRETIEGITYLVVRLSYFARLPVTCHSGFLPLPEDVSPQ